MVQSQKSCILYEKVTLNPARVEEGERYRIRVLPDQSLTLTIKGKKRLEEDDHQSYIRLFTPITYLLAATSASHH
jgi:hypothetical protein